MDPPTLEWIESNPALVGGIAALIPFIFGPVRRSVFGAIRKALEWMAEDRIRFQETVLEKFTEQDSRAEWFKRSLERVEEKVNKADKALFNGGRTGLVQQVRMLTAEANQAFEEAEFPMWKCDQNGLNLATNAAYRRMIGFTRTEELEGRNWQSVITGELKASYEAAFARCAKYGEAFYHEVDFRNPFNGDSRGRWRIVAPCYSVGDGFIYIGTMHPADDLATEILNTIKVDHE